MDAVETTTCAPATEFFVPSPVDSSPPVRSVISGEMAKQPSMLASLRNRAAGPLSPLTSSVQTTVMSFQPSCAVRRQSLSMPTCGPPFCRAIFLPLRSLSVLKALRPTRWSPADQVNWRKTTGFVSGLAVSLSEAWPNMLSVPRRNGLLLSR